MISCSAPGKVILFGEHAVVHGEPAIALAVNRRIHCDVSQVGGETTVNDEPINREHHEYLLAALDEAGSENDLNIRLNSELPSGAGMGSSAALTTSFLGCLHGLRDELSEEVVAKDGFSVEYAVQGSASPIDTSTSTHGSAVMLAKEKSSDFLWKIRRDKKVWYVHHRDIPDMQLVVGDTQVHARTGPLVEKVSHFYHRNKFGKQVVHDIGKLVLEGSRALEDGDLQKMGELMDKNHRLLSILGVSHPKLEGLVKAARRHSYGAKLTGAGGGGAMVALTDEPEEVARAIERRGGVPYMVDASEKGVTIERKD